jgi:hypothetical protein
MAGLVFVAELRIPAAMPSAREAEGPEEAGLGKLGYEAHYMVCLRTLQLLMIYWRGIGWILTAIQQKYKGVKETDPGPANIDPYSEVALSDRKMIRRLLRHVEGNNNKNLSGTADGLQDASKSGAACFSARPSEFQAYLDTAIGIAVTGTTNPAAKKTVTVIESSDPRYGQETFTLPLPDDSAASSKYVGDLDIDLVETSWLGDSELWNLGFEHFHNFNDFNHFNQFDSLNQFDNLNEFDNLDNLDYFDHPA